jgi:lysylphosphatidylglycerol synthetase-like protein (DUF2156 family)
MLLKLRDERWSRLWQALFLILGTCWLWATYLNPKLSYRVSLISQYETPTQPWSWLFRLSDVLAGLLLLLAARYFLAHAKARLVGIVLLVISIGLVWDPVFVTNCQVVAGVCHEYFSLGFVLHGAETIITATFILALSVYDARQRRKVISISFVLFQVAYGILFLTQLADQEHFNTLSQYIYQTSLIVWLAWYVRDYWLEDAEGGGRSSQIRLLVAGWALLNGVVAILAGLAHLSLVGRIKGVYFASDNAWLAQHGFIIGVVMIYLARHLARGERRARQIFLLIAGVEVIKYSIISPHAGLMAFYFLTFVGLFIARDSFMRGAVPLTWRLRLKDLAFMLGGLLLAMFAGLIALDRDNRASVITTRSIDNLTDYLAAHGHVPRDRLSSVLLAHGLSAFILAAAISILWILFRPNKIGLRRNRDYGRIRDTLKQHSRSSEDFFKLWPPDKNYFWSRQQNGFIAYKIVGSTAFALADPICKNRPRLINEFIIWCRGRRLKACFLPVYESSLEMYQKCDLELMQIGSSAEINIEAFLNKTVKDKWWRWQINRAAKAGYTYSVSAAPHTKELIRRLKQVSDSWLNINGHSERVFALGYFDNWYLQQCTIHYLTDNTGAVVAFTNELPQFNPLNKATVDFLRYEPKTNNAMTFLLSNVVSNVHELDRKAVIFDLGFVPFAKAKGPLLTIAKSFSRDRFSARGLEQFKNKFKPDWRPNYMAYDGDLADLAIIALSIEKLMEKK